MQKPFAATQPQIKSYDPIWSQVRREAEEISAAEPALAGFIYATVLDHARLEDAICHRLGAPGRHSGRAIERIAHALWQAGRKDFALYLQSLTSRFLQVDIHPAAVIGKGIMFDHATGIVIGETAVIGDKCSMLP